MRLKGTPMRSNTLCAVPNCDCPRREITDDRGQKHPSIHCRRHTCHTLITTCNGAIHVCDRLQRPNSRHCTIHPQCHEPSCQTQRLADDPNSRPGGKWCSLHACSFPNCNNRSILDPVGSGIYRCPAHRLCNTPGCQNIVAHVAGQRGRWLPVCQTHIVVHCRVSGCHNPAASSWTLFCRSHKCELDCAHGRVSGGIWCSEHTCRSETCKMPIAQPRRVDREGRDASARYCQNHECRKSLCFAAVAGRLGTSHFCRHHKCGTSGCENDKLGDSDTGDYCMRCYTESIRRSGMMEGRLLEHEQVEERNKVEEEKRREEELAKREQEYQRAERRRTEEDIRLLKIKYQLNAEMAKYEKARREEAERALKKHESNRKALEDFEALSEVELRRRKREDAEGGDWRSPRRRVSFGGTSTVGSASTGDQAPAEGWPGNYGYRNDALARPRGAMYGGEGRHPHFYPTSSTYDRDGYRTEHGLDHSYDSNLRRGYPTPEPEDGYLGALYDEPPPRGYRAEDPRRRRRSYHGFEGTDDRTISGDTTVESQRMEEQDDNEDMDDEGYDN